MKKKQRQALESLDGWEEFCANGAKDFYPTYDEAANAARKLWLRTEGEYRKGYKRDSYLPSNPNATYKDKGWVSWPHFFGKS